MLISAPGLTDRHSPRVRQCGFSLIEMIVVLAIIGIVSGIAGLSVGSTDTPPLLQDARLLARIFPVAHMEARHGGRVIVWEYGKAAGREGYRFARAPHAIALPASLMVARGPVAAEYFEEDTWLRPRDWRSGSGVSVRTSEPVRFGAEWIPDPLWIELSQGSDSVRIERQADGRYEVVTP